MNELRHKPTPSQRVEEAVGELMAALFAWAETDAVSAYHAANNIPDTLRRFRMDLASTGRVTRKDV